MDVHLLGRVERAEPLERDERGYHEGVVEGVAAGATYRLSLDGSDRPDPASRSQPEGVHGPSQVIDPGGFRWTDASWRNPPLERYVIVEVHVGTFTDGGTFDAAIEVLDELVELGVTAVELMPIGQFPGDRNWGYDGVFPFAVQGSYGGPEAFARFVDACHGRGLAVVLDVVYNHLGPEGNVLRDFGPYFTDRYRTPWGDAINFDGPGSDEVRTYFEGNAMSWFRDFHVDALRLDAIHGIVDTTARPFLLELGEATRDLSSRLGRPLYLIAESDLNEPRVVTPPGRGGYGLDAQWNDDFHHAVHAVLTGERAGYYQDFGSVGDIATALRDGFVFQGQHSRFRGRRHGAPSEEIPAGRLVAFVQNHDQVGNRAAGDRLSSLVPFERRKLAAGLLLLSPFVPLLFMGEEYGEDAPFPYFVSHSDPELVDAVRRGRAEEFASFGWQGDVPDPQDAETFESARLHRELRHTGEHRALWELHAELLRLRRTHPALSDLSKEPDQLVVESDEGRRALGMIRRADGASGLCLFNLSETPTDVTVPDADSSWRRLIASSEERWGGPGAELPDTVRGGAVVLAPDSFAVYEAAG